MAADEFDRLIALTAPPLEPLTILRSSHLHRPLDVLHLGEKALSSKRLLSPSSSSYWDLIADMCRAASECGQFSQAQALVSRVLERFPGSTRAATLNGILLEAQGFYNRAMRLYMGLIADSSNSPAVYKRQIAVLKAQLKWDDAIAMTNYFLTIYTNDCDAWAELCALCLRTGRHAHALFAASELVAQDARNFAYHILLADVYMTCGGTENLKMACVHYTTSANMHKRGNLRALYGIWLTSSMLMDIYEEGPSQVQCEKSLHHVRAAILAVYQSAYDSENQYAYVREVVSNPLEREETNG